MESARQKMAIISVATVISKASRRGTPFFPPPRPSSTARSCRSFMSTQRCSTTRAGSMPSVLP